MPRSANGHRFGHRAPRRSTRGWPASTPGCSTSRTRSTPTPARRAPPGSVIALVPEGQLFLACRVGDEGAPPRDALGLPEGFGSVVTGISTEYLRPVEAGQAFTVRVRRIDAGMKPTDRVREFHVIEYELTDVDGEVAVRPASHHRRVPHLTMAGDAIVVGHGAEVERASRRFASTDRRNATRCARRDAVELADAHRRTRPRSRGAVRAARWHRLAGSARAATCRTTPR